LRDTLVMIQCTNCGKTFNRAPAEIAKSVMGEYFCGWDCWSAYKSKHYGKFPSGLVPREKRVEMAVMSLKPGVEYKTIEISKRVPQSRTVIETRALVRYLVMRDDIRSVGRGVWVRV
jgi:predicted  nucleic acid-binding Zn-ribbon protein